MRCVSILPRTPCLITALLVCYVGVVSASVVDFEETFTAHDELTDFNIQLGDARLPMSAAKKENIQLRVTKKDQKVDLEANKRREHSAEKSSKGSKKGEKSNIPDDLFRSHSPTPVPMPTTEPPQITMYPSTMSPTIPSSYYNGNYGHNSEQANHIPHAIGKKDRGDDDDDDDNSKGKKAKYGSAVLPPTYNDVKEKFVGPDVGESMKPIKKLSPHKDKDGKTHYVDEKEEQSEYSEGESEAKTYYKKSKLEDEGRTKGSSAKLQKNKQEPRHPKHRMTHSPTSHVTTPSPSTITAPPSMRITEFPTFERTLNIGTNQSNNLHSCSHEQRPTNGHVTVPFVIFIVV